MTDKYIIRTSDRGTFRKCRQLWDFSSKIRMNWEPNQTTRQLDLGTGIHAGLEALYNPETWNLRSSKPAVLVSLAQAALVEAFPHPTDRYGNPESDPEIVYKWREDVELGKKMLAHYLDYSIEHDMFTPVYREIEFEVPIPCRVPSHDLPPHFRNVDATLYFKSLPVVYQGKIDLIVKDYDGKYWVWDHKKRDRFQPWAWYSLDTQGVSYCWAIQHQLGIPIAGMIYNEVKPVAPGPPKELTPAKDGTRRFSKDKSQNVSYKTYLSALDKAGVDPLPYQDFLLWLQENPFEFARRLWINHVPEKYEIASINIFDEAIDMLGDPRIYPNPSQINCNGCRFLAPCEAKQENGDYSYILEEMYHQR